MMYNEKELLLRIAEGDEKAFEKLMLHYSGLIHSFIYKHVNKEELVEELVSDVFLHIWQTRETLLDIRNFGSYLFVLSRNQAFNAMKKELRERRRSQNWYLDQETVTGESNEALAQGISLVEQAIEQLAPQQQKVWRLSRREAMTYEQIAEKLQISRETVKSHLQAANRSIREYVLSHIELSVGLLVLTHLVP